jgi:hypothetical protein
MATVCNLTKHTRGIVDGRERDSFAEGANANPGTNTSFLRPAGHFIFNEAAISFADMLVTPECEDGDDYNQFPDYESMHYFRDPSSDPGVLHTNGGSGFKQTENAHSQAPIINLKRNLAYDIDGISDHRLRARLLRNRASAERSRLRRMTAEDKLQERLVDLEQTRAALRLENDTLQQQLIAAQVCASVNFRPSLRIACFKNATGMLRRKFVQTGQCSC